jgi:hypothetical protein
MLNLNTIFLVFAERLVPPRTTSDEAPLVVVEKPTVVLRAVPPNEVSSVPELAVIHELEPSEPFKYSDPEPKLAISVLGQFGAAATAVPPFVVVWKSHPATSVCADTAAGIAERTVPNEAASRALDQREALGGVEGGDLMDGMFIGSMCLIQNK